MENGYVDMACARLAFVVVVTTGAPPSDDSEASSGGERIRVRRWVYILHASVLVGWGCVRMEDEAALWRARVGLKW